jgi:hypothetical protein
MKQEKVAFDFLAELENLGFKKDDMEEVFIRPRDGFSFKMIKANNGKDTFSLINMKKQFNRHVATCEWPYNEEEFFILMKKLSVI